MLPPRVKCTAHAPQFTSSRAVARILHGIASPQFPAIDWSNHRLWRRYADADFNTLRLLAQEEIRAERLGRVPTQ